VGTDRFHQHTLHRTGRFDIRANAILPGAAESPRIQKVLEDRAKLSGKSVEEEKKSAMSVQSLQRVVDPGGIADISGFPRFGRW
jgi:NAD(P)-dependent dehydrogenase (short-subunit alcohol dehydrogenase family)